MSSNKQRNLRKARLESSQGFHSTSLLAKFSFGANSRVKDVPLKEYRNGLTTS